MGIGSREEALLPRRWPNDILEESWRNRGVHNTRAGFNQFYRAGLTASAMVVLAKLKDNHDGRRRRADCVVAFDTATGRYLGQTVSEFDDRHTGAILMYRRRYINNTDMERLAKRSSQANRRKSIQMKA